MSGEWLNALNRDDENELALRDKKEVEAHLQNVWKTMKDCIEHGIKTEGVLPGPLKLLVVRHHFIVSWRRIAAV